MTARRVVRTARAFLALGLCASVSDSVLVAQRIEAARGPSTERRGSWGLITTVDQGWDSNVRFLSSSDADYITQVRSVLTGMRVRPRGRIGVTASGGLVRYGALSSFNTFNYSAIVDGSRRLTPFLTGWASAGYQKLLTVDVVGPGLPLLGLANQNTVLGNLGIERRFTPLTSLRVEGGYTSTTFDTDRLLPGDVITGRSELRHRYSPRGAMSLVAKVQQGDAQGVSLEAQALEAGWEPRIGSATLRVLAGATRVVLASTTTYLPTGSVQLSDSVGARAVFQAGLSRDVAQAFGLGQLLTNEIGTVSYDFRARSGDFLTLTGVVARSSPTSGTGTEFVTQAVTAGVRRVLSTGVTFGAGATYRRRKDVVVASGYGGLISLGYSLGSR
jgi:hypothetical protein